MASNSYGSVYRNSSQEASWRNELPVWRESLRKNIACKEAIEESIRIGFDGWNLNGNCAREVIDRFGFERVEYVLANTLREKQYDGRFSQSNKQWGQSIFVPPDEEYNFRFVVNSHPAVLDGFIDQYHREYQALGLFGAEQCVENPRRQDYEGKVLVLHPYEISGRVWEPQHQLWYAHDGFGCSPTARGQSIRCTCLASGETCRWNRSDFIGPIQEEHLPDWAREQMSDLNLGQAWDTVPEQRQEMSL